jgi:hypothetical protein
MAESRDPSPLDYESPPPRSPTPVADAFARIFGIFAGLIALLMLLFGLMGLVYSALYSKRGNRVGDLFEALLLLTIGLFCAFASTKWCREGFRRK